MIPYREYPIAPTTPLNVWLEYGHVRAIRLYQDLADHRKHPKNYNIKSGFV